MASNKHTLTALSPHRASWVTLSLAPMKRLALVQSVAIGSQGEGEGPVGSGGAGVVARSALCIGAVHLVAGGLAQDTASCELRAGGA